MLEKRRVLLLVLFIVMHVTLIDLALESGRTSIREIRVCQFGSIFTLEVPEYYFFTV